MSNVIEHLFKIDDFDASEPFTMGTRNNFTFFRKTLKYICECVYFKIFTIENMMLPI